MTQDHEDLPSSAKERLHEMRGSGASRKLFTSDLSVNEFLLVKKLGSAGRICGWRSINHIGYQQARWTKNEEMTTLTQALYHARELAMTRMEKEEADELGADARIIGVRLKVKHMSWNTDLAEFVALGTAVYHRDSAADGKSPYRTVDGKPFTSDLSGQDFWTLLRSGYRPVGMVMGNCVYHIAHQSFGQF